MNYEQAQRDVFESLLHGKKTGYSPMKGNMIAVTPDGYVMYIFHADKVVFRYDIMREFPPLKILEIVTPENRLKKMPDIREINCREYRRFTKGRENVFVNRDFLRRFSPYAEYYKAADEPQVVVAEKGEPVGLVLPLVAHGYDDFYTDTSRWTDPDRVDGGGNDG